MQTDCTEREKDMENPISHFGLVERAEWMQEVYRGVWSGQYVGEGYRVLASGSVTTRPPSDAHSDFGWKIVAAEAEGEFHANILLTWTDFVANDWGEWFFGEEAFLMATDRLAELIRVVYAGETLTNLEDFARGRV